MDLALSEASKASECGMNQIAVTAFKTSMMAAGFGQRSNSPKRLKKDGMHAFHNVSCEFRSGIRDLTFACPGWSEGANLQFPKNA